VPVPPLYASPSQFGIEIAQRREEPDVARIENTGCAVERMEIAPLEEIGYRDHGGAHGTRFVRTLRERDVARNPEREAHLVGHYTGKRAQTRATAETSSLPAARFLDVCCQI